MSRYRCSFIQPTRIVTSNCQGRNMRLMRALKPKGHGQPPAPERSPRRAAITCSGHEISAILLGRSTPAEYFDLTGYEAANDFTLDIEDRILAKARTLPSALMESNR